MPWPGIGLAIVKKILEDHGGRVTLDDRVAEPDWPGGGAVAADGDFALLALVEEAPAVEQFAVAVEADAVEAGQFFDAVGLAVAGEVVGRGDEHAGVVAQLAADELGVLREAVAQHEVDGVAVEVDEAVRQVHDEAQLRVALADLVDEGAVRSTAQVHLGSINAANLRRAHVLAESGTALGKIVLEGFGAEGD